MRRGQLTIRPFAERDADRLYEICLRTGRDGQDASDVHEDPRILGEVYVGPYLTFAPDLAFVLVDDDDVPVGYTLGAADTAAFESLCDARWWPQLRERYGARADDTPDAAVVRLIHAGQQTPVDVVRDYPAHLHIDLLPAAHGTGDGRRLLEHLLTALRDRGVRGVHLGVAAGNTRATGFYRHIGFTTLDQDAAGARLGLLLAGWRPGGHQTGGEISS